MAPRTAQILPPQAQAKSLASQCAESYSQLPPFRKDCFSSLCLVAFDNVIFSPSLLHSFFFCVHVFDNLSALPSTRRAYLRSSVPTTNRPMPPSMNPGRKPSTVDQTTNGSAGSVTQLPEGDPVGMCSYSAARASPGSPPLCRSTVSQEGTAFVWRLVLRYLFPTAVASL